MGRFKDTGLLLQLFQLYPDNRKAQEQDEDSSCCRQKTARGRVAHPLRGCRLQGVP